MYILLGFSIILFFVDSLEGRKVINSAKKDIMPTFYINDSLPKLTRNTNEKKSYAQEASSKKKACKKSFF